MRYDGGRLACTTRMTTMACFGMSAVLVLINIVTTEAMARAANVIHVPSICQKHIKLHDDSTDEVLKFNVSGNASHWIHYSKGKSCDIRITKDTQYQLPAMCYQLRVDIKSGEDDTLSRCHFDILLYSGEILGNQPIERLSCHRNRSMVIDWPSPFVIASLSPTTCGHNTTDSLSEPDANVVIQLSIHAKNQCEHTISEKMIAYKQALCGGEGCFDSNYQGYKMSAESTDTRVCWFNISLHRSSRVCLKQNFVDEKRWQACRFIKWHTDMFIDGKLYMKIGCDHIHNWWCIPRKVDGNIVSFRWEKDWRQCSSKNNIRVVSLSKYTETYACGSKYTPIATNVTTHGRENLAEHEKYIAIIILIAILLILLIAMLLVLRSLVDKMRGGADQNSERSRQVSVVSFNNNPPPYPGKLSKTNMNYLPSYQSALELSYHNSLQDLAVDNNLGTQNTVIDGLSYIGDSSAVRIMSNALNTPCTLPVNRSFNMYDGNSIRASFVIGDGMTSGHSDEIGHHDNDQLHLSPFPMFNSALCNGNSDNIRNQTQRRPNLCSTNSSKGIIERREVHTTSLEERRSGSDTTDISEYDVEPDIDDVNTTCEQTA